MGYRGNPQDAKSLLKIPPIFHQSNAAIAGHLFCSFLALVLRKELDKRLTVAEVSAEWGDIIRNLDRVEQGTTRFVLHTQAPGCAGAVGAALPRLVRQLPITTLHPGRRCATATSS